MSFLENIVFRLPRVNVILYARFCFQRVFSLFVFVSLRLEKHFVIRSPLEVRMGKSNQKNHSAHVDLVLKVNVEFTLTYFWCISFPHCLKPLVQTIANCLEPLNVCFQFKLDRNMLINSNLLSSCCSIKCSREILIYSIRYSWKIIPIIIQYFR